MRSIPRPEWSTFAIGGMRPSKAASASSSASFVVALSMSITVIAPVTCGGEVTPRPSREMRTMLPGLAGLAHVLVAVIRAATRILFSLGGSRDYPEADSPEERVQIVRDVLVKAVKFATPLFGQHTISAEWREQSRSEGRVDFLK